ncbi:lysine-specific demethylase JMJ28 isoform X3 [Elaeis guineensis]|uniref:lysine-specific demethylase JMJ28 isoform X3 n=2 Tax=Elaeis guineensis var. tenera TaxID=51953 RepID=UPI003C6D3B3A
MGRARGAAPVPDELRCRRSDGRHWRCPRRAMSGVSFCEHHYRLARRNQAKHKGLVDSPPTPRRKPGRSPRSRPEPPDPPPRKRRRKGDPPTEELIAAALRRQIERREEMETKKEEDEGRTEVTRDLPNGVMTISLTSARVSGNAGPPLVQKLGFHQGPFLRRSIRSKNVEPLPVGPLKKFPCGKGLGRGRKRICHRCGESKAVRMVRCSSCLKESFCSSCVKKWYSEMSEVEVKVSCPICRGYCDCKTCMLAGAKAGGCKKFSTGQTNFIQIKYAYYLIDQLLPVLKQISQEQKTELEIEANNQGRRLSGVQIQVAERGPDELLNWIGGKSGGNSCENVVFHLSPCFMDMLFLLLLTGNFNLSLQMHSFTDIIKIPGT